MATTFGRVTRLLEELETLLDNDAVRRLLQQLPLAEAAFFIARQRQIRELVRRSLAEIPRRGQVSEGRQWLAELAMQMDKAQKSLVAAEQPDAIRSVAKQVSNLGLRLDQRFELMTSTPQDQAETPAPPEPPPAPRLGQRAIRPATRGFAFVVPPDADIPFALELSTPPPPAAAAPETTEPAPRRPPRYANAVLLDQHRGTRLDPGAPLPWGQVLRLRLDIGRLSPESQVGKPAPIAETITTDIDLDVMVSSTDFAVATQLRALETGRPTIAHGGFFLPADGAAATAHGGGKYLTFYLKTPDAPPAADAHPASGRAHCRIGYYVRNVLIQSQRLAADLGGTGGFTIETDFTLSSDLTQLGELPRRPRISIFTNANDGDSHQIILRHPGKIDADIDPSETFTLREANIAGTLGALRRTLAMNAPTTRAQRRDELEANLRALAPLGRSLYDQLSGGVTNIILHNLWRNPEAYVVQVSRPDSSSFVMPWDFIYEISLNSDVEPTLCPLVSAWDGKAPLFAGSPRQCPEGPHGPDVLCPFGFWGFRYAIEQMARSDALALAIKPAANSDFVVCETQVGLKDANTLATHVADLRKILTGVLPGAQLREGKDRTTVRALLGEDLPLVYFYCHGEKISDADANTWLVVGQNEKITAGDFKGWVDDWFRTLNKRIWNEVRPLVFINACHSVAIEPKTLVNYVDAFIGKGNAAGVIGTEVKIDQDLAIDVANRFFESFLGRKENVDTALRAIRLDYLRQGNLFGLVYTPYCWAELQIAGP
jgi:CHAT domain